MRSDYGESRVRGRLINSHDSAEAYAFAIACDEKSSWHYVVESRSFILACDMRVPRVGMVIPRA